MSQGQPLGDNRAMSWPSPEHRQFMATMWHRWSHIVKGGLAGSVLLGTTSLVIPSTYNSDVRFVVDSPNNAAAGLSGGLLGVATELGFLTGGESSSPLFYAELVNSNLVLVQLVRDTFRLGPDTPSRPLPELLRISGDSNAKVELRTVIRLRKMIDASADMRTGIVTIRVAARSGYLATDLTKRLVRAVEVYNRELRATRARNERLFLEREVDSARAALRASEDSLRGFYETNKEFRSSPRLVFREVTLKRQSDLAVGWYTGLVQQLDRARLAEVRDVPAITLLEPPIPPLRRTKPMRLAWALFGLALGLTAATIGPLTLKILTQDQG